VTTRRAAGEQQPGAEHGDPERHHGRLTDPRPITGIIHPSGCSSTLLHAFDATAVL
jgi:hypothetical protein